jgi:intergrase/recombinase
LIVTFGLVSGLREQELEYIYRQRICSNKVGTCDCGSLHIAEKENITAILIMWKRGKKISYYTMVPTELWQRFRRLSHFTYCAEIRKANEKTKEAAGVLFKDLRKFHYNVLKRFIDRDAIEALHGRTSDVTTKHYSFQLTGLIAEAYKKAWAQYGLVF